MSLENSRESWGAVAKGFHWTIALLIIGLLALGLYMTGLPIGPAAFKLFFLHKSLGITVLALAALRLGWKLANIRPDAPAGHRRWEKGLAHATHMLLYFAMFAMPLSGWIMSSAKNFHVSVFGLFTLPDLVAPDPALAERAAGFHTALAWVLMAAIALHAAGAFKHHIIDRDDTLLRMLPFAGRRSGAGQQKETPR